MFLATISLEKGDTGIWAQGLLKLLLPNGTPTKLVLLALTAEFMECCRNFIHAHEAKGTTVAQTAEHIANLKHELYFLLEPSDDAGRPRIPYALDPSYSNGYVNQVLVSNLGMKATK